MKVTVFGNPDSIFNIELKKELEQKNVNVEIFSLYDELDKLVKIKIKYVSKLLALFKFFKRFKVPQRKKNILHIQSLTYFVPASFVFINACFGKKILTFWGSDLLLKNEKELKKYKYLFNSLDSITVATEDMKDYFLKIFPQYHNKIHIVRFGLSELDVIDNIRESDLVDFKKKYLNNTKKKIITVGYNRIPSQQHIKVIESFSTNKKEDFLFVFPWTYGFQEKGYKERLLELLQNKQFDFVFLETFLSDKEIACLRILSDFFIQVQIKDALSGSMQEALYAGSMVITGEWLNYSVLDKEKIQYWKVQSVNEIGTIISEILSKQIVLNKDINKEIISKLSKWTNVIDNWYSLY